jgi:hypothetical protein
MVVMKRNRRCLGERVRGEGRNKMYERMRRLRRQRRGIKGKIKKLWRKRDYEAVGTELEG